MVQIKKIENKKAFLFSIISILLSISLMLLGLAYLDRSKELKNLATNSLINENLGYIEDDIINNAYLDLLWLNISSIEHIGDDVWIRFNKAGILSPYLNYIQITDDYKEFIETKYSRKNNINISLDSFYNNFTIKPYNSSFLINKTRIYFYSNDINSLREIILTILVNESKTKEISNTTPTDSGSMIITVNVYDKDGFDLFQGNVKTKNLDPMQANDAPPFEVVFQSSSIKVGFGSYEGNNGMLRIESNNLIANITQLDIRYLSNEKIKIINNGEVNIKSKIGNISKVNDIVLFEE